MKSLLILFLFAFLLITDHNAMGQGRKREVHMPDLIKMLLQKHSCTSCHHPDKKLVGPSFAEIAKRNYSGEKIANLILKPDPGNWPQFPAMPVLDNIHQDDASRIGDWINSIQKK